MVSPIHIMILTLGRLHSQTTLDSIPEHLKKQVTLVVQSHEFDDHCWEYGDICNVLSLPKDVKGIGNTRQYCIELSVNLSHNHLFMLDDDLVFFKRNKDGKLKHATDIEIQDMFLEQLDVLGYEDIFLTGVSARSGNNHVKEDYKDVTRQSGFHGVNTKKFIEHNIRFDKSELMEDFHVLLDMFTQAMPNRVFYKYCWDQKGGSGSAGGCSTFRTPELQAKCAQQLKDRFPDYVTVVDKKSKTAWKGMEIRKDVRIQWKKAYNNEVAYRNGVCDAMNKADEDANW